MHFVGVLYPQGVLVPKKRKEKKHGEYVLEAALTLLRLGSDELTTVCTRTISNILFRESQTRKYSTRSRHAKFLMPKAYFKRTRLVAPSAKDLMHQIGASDEGTDHRSWLTYCTSLSGCEFLGRAWEILVVPVTVVVPVMRSSVPNSSHRSAFTQW